MLFQTYMGSCHLVVPSESREKDMENMAVVVLAGLLWGVCQWKGFQLLFHCSSPCRINFLLYPFCEVIANVKWNWVYILCSSWTPLVRSTQSSQTGDSKVTLEVIILWGSSAIEEKTESFFFNFFCCFCIAVFCFCAQWKLLSPVAVTTWSH